MAALLLFTFNVVAYFQRRKYLDILLVLSALDIKILHIEFFTIF